MPRGRTWEENLQQQGLGETLSEGEKPTREEGTQHFQAEDTACAKAWREESAQPIQGTGRQASGWSGVGRGLIPA